MTLIQNDNIRGYDRDLLGNSSFQDQWRASDRKPVCHFSDKRGRTFTIYLLVRTPLSLDGDEQHADAASKGFTELLQFGAVNDHDGMCYGAFGLYHGDAVSHVTERMIEVDLANRFNGIGRHLYWCGQVYCEKRGKPFQGSGRSDTVAGQLFGRAQERDGSPFKPEDVA